MLLSTPPRLHQTSAQGPISSEELTNSSPRSEGNAIFGYTGTTWQTMLNVLAYVYPNVEAIKHEGIHHPFDDCEIKCSIPGEPGKYAFTFIQAKYRDEKSAKDNITQSEFYTNSKKGSAKYGQLNDFDLAKYFKGFSDVEKCKVFQGHIVYFPLMTSGNIDTSNNDIWNPDKDVSILEKVGIDELKGMALVKPPQADYSSWADYNKAIKAPRIMRFKESFATNLSIAIFKTDSTTSPSACLKEQTFIEKLLPQFRAVFIGIDIRTNEEKQKALKDFFKTFILCDRMPFYEELRSITHDAISAYFKSHNPTDNNLIVSSLLTDAGKNALQPEAISSDVLNGVLLRARSAALYSLVDHLSVNIKRELQNSRELLNSLDVQLKTNINRNVNSLYGLSSDPNCLHYLYFTNRGQNQLIIDAGSNTLNDLEFFEANNNPEHILYSKDLHHLIVVNAHFWWGKHPRSFINLIDLISLPGTSPCNVYIQTSDDHGDELKKLFHGDISRFVEFTDISPKLEVILPSSLDKKVIFMRKSFDYNEIKSDTSPCAIAMCSVLKSPSNWKSAFAVTAGNYSCKAYEKKDKTELQKFSGITCDLKKIEKHISRFRIAINGTNLSVLSENGFDKVKADGHYYFKHKSLRNQGVDDVCANATPLFELTNSGSVVLHDVAGLELKDFYHIRADHNINVGELPVRTLLMADYGMGKSHLLKKMAFDYLDNDNSLYPNVPIYLFLPDIIKYIDLEVDLKKAVNWTGVITKFYHNFFGYSFSIFERNVLTKMLADGGITLLVDAFDEIYDADKNRCREALERLFDLSDHKQIILAVRPYATPLFCGFQPIVLTLFDSDQWQKLLREELTASTISKSELEIIVGKLEANKFIGELITRPLHARIIIRLLQYELSQIPRPNIDELKLWNHIRDRAGFYQFYFTELLYDYAEKHLGVESPANLQGRINILTQTLTLKLAQLGFNTIFPSEEPLPLFSPWDAKQINKSEVGVNVLDSELLELGLLHKTEVGIQFILRGFAEYFAAYYLMRNLSYCEDNDSELAKVAINHFQMIAKKYALNNTCKET